MTNDYSKAPRHEAAVRRYVERGIIPGHFLTAVLEDSLTRSYARADKKNTVLMYEWVEFIVNELPADCWGSHEKVTAWAEAGGQDGIREDSAQHPGGAQ